ncbi:MAG: hypothetical protein NTW58_01835 [Actinobacteria bacterium]|nr:hypothetical protein [Actinomycetota bacterium]
MKQPFQASPIELSEQLEGYVDAVYASLESQFLVLPKGGNFVEYARFQEAYETLKRATKDFRAVDPAAAWDALLADSLATVVLRCILGMTPPEWADLAASDSGLTITQNFARSLDGKVRTDREYLARLSERKATTLERVVAMVETACRRISAGVTERAPDTLHRLDKVDTAEGIDSVRRAADFHVPYAMLLYERLLGRPFASHRDSVSELIGDVMESAVEAELLARGVSFRKTKRAERVPGFDQAPDFITPDEYAPAVVIEAKITNDDGTARDKFTRIIHLVEQSKERIASGQPGFEVVACIDGRGFGIRREDMRRLLIALEGKVFTLATLGDLVAHTALARFAS